MNPSTSSAVPSADTERLLTFEYAQAMYALPIAEVHEVAEAKRICCVPTIPFEQVGVMNWHGEALPVVAVGLLLERAPEAAAHGAAPANHVLVVSGRGDEPARLGLPVDRVLGLIDGPSRHRSGEDLVVERRPLEGRVVHVLCPRVLVARAAEVIGRQVA